MYRTLIFPLSCPLLLAMTGMTATAVSRINTINLEKFLIFFLRYNKLSRAQGRV
jgi:hypothetical protein